MNKFLSILLFFTLSSFLQSFTQESSHDLNNPWDGKANKGREIAQEDVYVWLVMDKDLYGKRHKYIGHVTLIR